MAKYLVGVDIGSRFTKAVVLEQAVRTGLVNATLFPTPFTTNKDGTRQVNAEELLKALQDFMPHTKLRQAKIGVNLPAASVTAASVLLPLMSKKELLFAAINDARQKMIPVSSPQHTFECLILGETMINKVPRAQVLVIRTEKAFVQKTIDLFKSIDTAPALISPACALLPNILPKEAWKKEEAILFVDIGAASSTISICCDGHIVFMRNIGYGTNDITADISRQLGVSEDQLGAVLKEQGVPQVQFDLNDKVAVAEEIMRQKYEASMDGKPEQQGPVNMLELRVMWQPHIERISQEIRRSILFYREQPQARTIDQIYFLGGGSSIRNLIQTLTASVGGTLRLVNPLKEMSGEVPADNPHRDAIANSALFSAAASLALSIPVAKTAGEGQINFLPLELKQKEAIAARRIVAVIVYCSVLGALVFSTIHLALSSAGIRKKIQQTKAKLAKVKKVADSLKEIGQQEALITQRTQQVDDLVKRRLDFAAVLSDIRNALPDKVVLARCAVTVTSLEVKAAVFADFESAQELAEEFKAGLAGLPYLQNLKVSELELEKVTTVEMDNVSGSVTQLTQAKKREFTVTADIVPGT